MDRWKRINYSKPERHTTLERALSESVQTLSASAQLVLRRLGRFSGIFTENDAIAVVPELDPSTVLAALDELVSNSLLSPVARDYRMLWVISGQWLTKVMVDPDCA